MERYICIHGHFYQPPRENPWLEDIEVQDSAFPFDNWNERITSECYAPNTAGRILDKDNLIDNIVNNYSKMSFNFGPTLLSWMEKKISYIYEDILAADKLSQEMFSGHGAAIAQAYNHMIMPLSNKRDKETQVIWGIKDFELRFKRKPEGMWLPETAVDIESLEVLAEHGIKYTILAPHQAKTVRKIGSKDWINVDNASVDPQIAYLCNLPSGKKINLFFYDGHVSQELAFKDLLKNGQAFANRLFGVFGKEDKKSRMVHIATDGETYGHHHKYGDMALAFCLDHVEKSGHTKLTIYGEYLEKFPPEYEVKINENTSWSCSHGVERWRNDCGCCIGGNPSSWNQKWRGPLRDALDFLRDEVNASYEKEMAAYHDDVWKVRNDYIDVILDREQKNVEKFLKEHSKGNLSQEDKIKILKMLEMQRHAMLMYTSCGWFFDEISGIETTQIIQYAARVIQLARELFGKDLEAEFLHKLAKAPSNIKSIENGAGVYEQKVKSTIIDLSRVGAHYAVSSLFQGYPKKAKIYCYSAESEAYDVHEAGKQKLVVGRTNIKSDITWEEDTISFALLHLVDHILDGGVDSDMDIKAFKKMSAEIKISFGKSDIPEVIRLINTHFGMNNYSLWHLFKQEQKQVLDQIMNNTLQDIEAHFRQLYDQHYFLMQVRRDLNIPLPKVLATTAGFVLNRDLLDALSEEEVDIKKLEKTIDEIQRWKFSIDTAEISHAATKRLDDLMRKFLKSHADILLLHTIISMVSVINRLDVNIDLWKAQNIFYKINKKFCDKKQEILNDSNSSGREWLDSFYKLGKFLNVRCC